MRDAREVDVPQACSIAALYATTHLADAFAIELPPHASRDAGALARFVLEGAKPIWLRALLGLRNSLVAPLGIKSSTVLKRGAGERIDFFRVYRHGAQEVVLGEDDRHLDFRVSVLVDHDGRGPGRAQVVMSTVVHCHNWIGRGYLVLIAPFHRMVVRSALEGAAARGWPVAEALH